MFTIEINSTGIKKKATIEKLFLHNGPFCITQSKNKDGFPVPLARLDYIETVEVVNDLSTRNTITTRCRIHEKNREKARMERRRNKTLSSFIPGKIS